MVNVVLHTSQGVDKTMAKVKSTFLQVASKPTPMDDIYSNIHILTWTGTIGLNTNYFAPCVVSHSDLLLVKISLLSLTLWIDLILAHVNLSILTSSLFNIEIIRAGKHHIQSIF